MQNIDSEHFESWTDKVKVETGLSLSAISKSLDMSKSMFFNYRNGTTQPSIIHFQSVYNKYSEILTEEAKAAGIKIKPAVKAPLDDRLQKILEKIESDKNKFDFMIEELEIYKKQLEAANKRQEDDAQKIQKLLSILDKKS